MKYLAIIKDSFRETFDSKVLVVMLILSLLVILLTASIQLDPLPPEKGMEKITERFSKALEIDVPVYGRFPVTPAIVEYETGDLENVNKARKPWDAEYKYTLDVTELHQLGYRLIVLWDQMLREQQEELRSPTKKKTRFREMGEAFEKEQERLSNSEEIRNLPPEKRDEQMKDRMSHFFQLLLNLQALALTEEDLTNFIKQQLTDKGNWVVTDVRIDEVTKTTAQAKVVTKQDNKEIIESKTVEVEKYRIGVHVKSRNGTRRIWPHKVSVLFGAIPIPFFEDNRPGRIVYNLEKYMAGSFGASVILLLSCIVTAFYIPNMLRKGTVDLLLVKPVSRWALLLYKYVGGLTFSFSNIAFLVAGLWLVIGIRTGIWEFSFLLMIFILTFQFALFYAVSTLSAVLTKSPIVSILLSVLLWAILFGLSWAYWGVDTFRRAAGADADSKLGIASWVLKGVDLFHGVLPRYGDLDALGSEVLYKKLMDPSEDELRKHEDEYKSYNWGEALGVTGGYIVLCLGLACWRFSYQDY